MTEPSEDFRKGYSAGWAANNEYRCDQHELQHVASDPATSLLLGCVMLLFGTLPLLASGVRVWRGWGAEWSMILPGLAFTIGALLILRSRKKSKLKAKKARENFEEKWGAS